MLSSRGAALFLAPTLSLLGGLAACSPATTTLDPGPSAPIVEYVKQQEVLTPLPLRVRLPSAMNVAHVVVLYRTWGSSGWTAMELGRAGQTWSGEVSCREVSTVTGDTRYYFVALDEDGEVVAGSGSPDWPHVATIVGSLPDGAQALPDGWLPLRCHDVADCPPDFPGCPAYAMRRRACRSIDDCAEGVRCAWDGYCGSPHAEPGMTAPPSGPVDEEEQLAVALRAVRKRFTRKTASATQGRRVHP